MDIDCPISLDRLHACKGKFRQESRVCVASSRLTACHLLSLATAYIANVIPHNPSVTLHSLNGSDNYANCSHDNSSAKPLRTDLTLHRAIEAFHFRH
ncbi:MAG TPA: hypothetical protein V6C65_02520 [Allocoleopsis sp.]